MTDSKETPILDIQTVTKAYQNKVAVNNISLQISKGRIFGLLGPNGAGKTTLIRMITRITMPDTGVIFLNGESLTEKHRAQIGYMPEERGLYKKMKVYEHLIYLLQLKDMTVAQSKHEADKWLERFELSKWKNNKVEELSKGMQQKVQFIATIAHKPPLIILDEPFSGLDPINSQLIEDIMRERKAEGDTIIFSTHRMEQAQELCDEIALINNGIIILHDKIRAVRKRFAGNLYAIETQDPIKVPNLPNEWKIEEQREYDIKITLPNNALAKSLFEVFAEINDVARFEHVLPNLREIFIEQVKRSQSGPLPENF